MKIYEEYKTGLKTTEVHVLDGNQNAFNKFLLQTGTLLGESDDNFDIVVGNGRLNLYCIQKKGTGSNTTEIHKMGYNDVDPAEEAAQKVIAEAKRYLGRPYIYGATGPNSFDCSGFTQYVFLHASRSKGVTISSLSNSYYNAHYGCARRVL